MQIADISDLQLYLRIDLLVDAFNLQGGKSVDCLLDEPFPYVISLTLNTWTVWTPSYLDLPM